MTEQFKAATIRALYGAIITAALTFFVTIQANLTVANRYEIAALAAAVAFFGYMLARGVTEGLIDSSRASSGNVTKADVGQ